MHVVSVAVLMSVRMLACVLRGVRGLAVGPGRRAGRRPRLACARGAEPHDCEVGETSLVAEPLFDLVAYGVELVRREGADRAAALAR